MGQYNYKNYILIVKLQENLTDSRFVEFMKDWTFTRDDLFVFQDTIEPLYNETAEKILNFFITYDKIDLCPDYYNTYEPINKHFNKEDLLSIIHSIAFPSGTLYLKKKKMFDVMISNIWYGLIFETKGNHQVIPSKKKIGEFLGEVSLFFDKKTALSMEQLETIVDDFCMYMETSYGIIRDQENNNILYKYQQK